jgi:hypothetical protein
MLEHIYYFISGITSFEYEVPIYLQISGFLALGVLATAIILIFGKSLNETVFKDSYMIYYFILILNIINIVAVLYYYTRKTGTFIGEEGEQGGKGLKGDIGTNVDCSLCINNLYMKKTQIYDTICRLDTSKYLDRLLDTATEEDPLLNTLISSGTFDYEQFATSLLVDGFDMTNQSVVKIFNYINAFEFLLYNNINIAKGVGTSRLTGYFRRPDVPLGNYCLGDVAMGGAEEYRITSFGLNGDIILPEGFNQICSFTTITEDGNVETYGAYSIIPPALEKFDDSDIPEDKRDLSKKPATDEYLSLGHVIAPLSSTGGPDKGLFACIKRSCCRKMKKGSLKFMFLYPAVGFSSNELLEEVNVGNAEDTENTVDTEEVVAEEEIPELRADTTIDGMFSVWRTPYNTIFIKYMDSSKLIDGKTMVEHMYLDMNSGGISDSLYTKYGTIKSVIKTRIKEELAKYTLDKITITGIIFSHIFEKVTNMLKAYYSKYIATGQLPDTNLLKTKLMDGSQDPITYDDIHKLLRDIENAIGTKKADLEAMDAKRKQIVKRKKILGLGEIDEELSNKGNTLSYMLQKEFQQIKSTTASISVDIANSSSLLDVVNSLFEGGINYIVRPDEMTYAQKTLLYTCACINTPAEDIWIMRNSCLVYEQVDEGRINLQEAVGEEIKRFNNLRNRLGSRAEDQCGSKDLTSINRVIDATYERLMQLIGHIPNALDKLNKLDLEEFTNEQLETIVAEMRKLVMFVEKKCS